MLLALMLAVAPAYGLCAPARADDGALSPERQREILRDALSAFDDAVATARDNPARAEQLYRQAAAAFERLVADGVRSAALEYNLGNTRFRLGDLGRAVLHYRRAQRLDPGDAKLAENLRENERKRGAGKGGKKAAKKARSQKETGRSPGKGKTGKGSKK